MPDVNKAVNAVEAFPVQCQTAYSGNHYRWCYRNSVSSTDDAAQRIGSETYTRTFADRVEAAQFKREFGIK